MQTGIIFVNERSPMVMELSAALQELGLARETNDSLTPELIDALNTYRLASSLPELDFADPLTLRSLGLECSGDDIMTLARYGEANAKCELEVYDCCLDAVRLCREHGLTIFEYTKMTPDTPVRASSVTAAMLAMLN